MIWIPTLEYCGMYTNPQILKEQQHSELMMQACQYLKEQIGFNLVSVEFVVGSSFPHFKSSFLEVPFLNTHLLQTTQPTFDLFVKQLKSRNQKRSIQRKMKTFEENNGVIRVEQDRNKLHEIEQDICNLYQQTSSKVTQTSALSYNYGFPELIRNFIDIIPPEKRFAILAIINDKILACQLVLVGDNMYHTVFSGMDYTDSRTLNSMAYFNSSFGVIRHAIEHHVQCIDFHMTTSKVKMEFGCQRNQRKRIGYIANPLLAFPLISPVINFLSKKLAEDLIYSYND